MPWGSAVLEAVAALAESLPLSLVETDLHTLPADQRRGIAHLVQAWDRLGSAQVTAASLADVLLVLTDTTLDEPVNSGISSFRGTEPVAPFRPTAAHPRAYEGTGARPPKPRAPRRIDLHAVALDPRASRILLDEFATTLPAAIQLLPTDLAPRTRRALSLAAEERTLAGWEGTALQRNFRVLVWPQTRWLPDVDLARLYGAFRSHGRHSELSLYVAAAWWLAERSPEAALPWLHAALQLPGRLAEVALMVCADLDAGDVPPDDLPLAEVAVDDNAARFALDLWSLIDAHRRRLDPRLLLPGLELSRGMELRRHVGCRSPREFVASAPLTEFAISHRGDDWQALAVDLWSTLSAAPGLADALLSRPWDDLRPEAVELLLEPMLWTDWGGEEERTALGAWWTEHLPATVDALCAVPVEFQEKFAATVGHCVAMWRRPEKLHALWPDFIALAGRLARPPFRADARAFEVWNNLVELRDADLRRQVIEAPDRLWLRLEKRSRVPANAYLLGLGLDVLGYHHGDVLVQAFLDGTPLLFEVARLLGGVSTESADALCGSMPEAPTDPILWLRDLHGRALAELGAGLAGDVSRREVQHALLLQRSISDNRRALRRLLRAHLDGQSDYVLRHPLSQRWVAAHPTLPLSTWLEGIALDVELDGIGPVTLRLEQDPLEVLQLGTYVGSCLSIGGLCDYSAAAAALDINKQVIYARTRKGGVIARQLVAVSDEGDLIAFSVYPQSAPRSVKRLFAEYDQRFAVALGLSVRTVHKGATYSIAEVLSENWWDDGAWKSAPEAGPTRAAS